MNPSPINADALVDAAFQALSQGDLSNAQAPIAQGLASHPTDSRLHLLAGVMANAQALPASAMAHFWGGLAADPQSALIRQEIRHLVVQELAQADGKPPTRFPSSGPITVPATLSPRSGSAASSRRRTR